MTIETKFNKGDTIYTIIANSELFKGKITGISIEFNKDDKLPNIFYNLVEDDIDTPFKNIKEERLFKTKDNLIQSLINQKI